MELPKNILREHVLRAIEKIDIEGVPARAQSNQYDVLFNNKRYPPKLVVSYANLFANGFVLDRSEFEGGEGTDAFKLLNEHGFEIVKKDSYFGIQPKIWFVTQGETFTQERGMKYIWAPIEGNDNRTRFYWKNVGKVKEGDYIFNYSKGMLRGVSIAKNSAYESENVVYDSKWKTKGYRVDIDLHLIKPEVTKDVLKSNYARIASLLVSIKNSAFAKNGEVNQGYLFEFTPEAGVFLRQLYGSRFGLEQFDDFLDNYKVFEVQSMTFLPKPFILLAGISGTGKSRFVREQAKKWSAHYPQNFELVSVRPDWHEPSDLLGYISRLNHAKYVSTPVLKFIAQAWVASVQRADENGFTLKDLAGIPPFWLCLDEMNLAPVEQYFADYLSVLETRKWEGDVYTCDPLLKADVFSKLGDAASIEFLRELIGDDYTNDPTKGGLAAYWKKNGISIPPNLIIAGTVNMDETTHGFSRKVIDRALTLDFQEFFPNDFDAFFGGQLEPKTFSFPTATDARDLLNQFGKADEDGARTRTFLSSLNNILYGTPFQLAFRALNEALLSLYSFQPKSDEDLQAVWDDFLMQKVLPRIEGDGSKLKADFVWPKDADQKLEQEFGKGTLLHKLYMKLQEKELLGSIWTEGRPDLLRDSAGTIECRSKKKLEWMMRRLKNTHFTDFWV